MNVGIKKTHFVFIVLVALSVATSAQAVSITFQVRLARQIELGQFALGQDAVDIAGTFNGWGGSPLTPLTDADGDTIFEVTLSGFTAGETIEFKFRINGLWDGSEEFPGNGPNRVYNVLPGNNEILVWYGDVTPSSGIGELHWWNDSVFYEIFVRSFADSDGDGIGDFAGLTAKLDYLNDGDPATNDDLGITGIWLMPINDSPSYHGYDATDYRGINPDYGTMADFQTFLAAAHARGIKVIIDYVMNHCSIQHPWYVAASTNNPAYRDYFRWAVDDPGQTGPWGQVVWHWQATGWYYGVFWGGMPDLNYETAAVKTEMFDTATYWLDTIGVDGFRLDAVLFLGEEGNQLLNTPSTMQFWQDFNTHVKAVNPDVVSVGEAWTSSSIVRQYVIDDRLDFCFEFDLSYATMDAAKYGYAGNLRSKASSVYNLYPHLQFGTFLTNHDQDRSFSVLGEDEGKAKIAAGIYLTLPGIPFVYYGEEVGMVGTGDHKFIRSPMQWTSGNQAGFTSGVPWQPVNSNYQQFNVSDEEQDSGSLLNWYRQLIRLRRDTLALRQGTHDPLQSDEPAVMAFVRRKDQQAVLCLANTASGALNNFKVTGSAVSLTPGDYTLTNLLDANDTFGITVNEEFEIVGLNLSGYELAVYQFYSASAVDQDDRAWPEQGLRIEENYPNPFNPSTTIKYALPMAAQVKLSIYDAAGREVAVLVNEVQEVGQQEVVWGGVDQAGLPVSAGVYLVRLEAGGETRRAKITLVK